MVPVANVGSRKRWPGSRALGGGGGIDQRVDRLQADLARGRVFEPLIEAWLLNNPHRLTFVTAPDANLDATARADEEALLAEVGLGGVLPVWRWPMHSTHAGLGARHAARASASRSARRP